MPLYWFHIDAPEPPRVLAQRIRSIVRAGPGFLDNSTRTRQMSTPLGRPFIGSVSDVNFKIRRDIRYRNGFLPMISGRIAPLNFGTRVSVTMYPHPAVAVFMLLWLGFAGRDGFGGGYWIPRLFFVFGVVLVTGGFFSEAVKAKRLLSAAILSSGSDATNNSWPIEVSNNQDNT
jgi:hypothetical protein